MESPELLEERSKLEQKRSVLKVELSEFFPHYGTLASGFGKIIDQLKEEKLNQKKEKEAKRLAKQAKASNPRKRTASNLKHPTLKRPKK